MKPYIIYADTKVSKGQYFHVLVSPEGEVLASFKRVSRLLDHLRDTAIDNVEVDIEGERFHISFGSSFLQKR